MELDKQVERYLSKPITRNDMISYQVNRRTGDFPTLTVEIYVDPVRFDNCAWPEVVLADPAPTQHVTDTDKLSEPEYLPKE